MNLLKLQNVCILFIDFALIIVDFVVSKIAIKVIFVFFLKNSNDLLKVFAPERERINNSYRSYKVKWFYSS